MSQTATTFKQCGTTTTTTATTTAVICCSFRVEDTHAGCCRGRWPPSVGPLVDHVLLVGPWRSRCCRTLSLFKIHFSPFRVILQKKNL